MGKNDWGSPYDPSYSGKMQKPKKKGEREHRKSQSRICWCGDPNCSVGLDGVAPRGGSFGGSGMPSYIRDSFTTFDARMREEFMRFDPIRSDRILQWQIDPSYDAPPSQPKGPPASYKKAREAVADYISEAPTQDFDDIVGNEDALNQLKDAIQAPVKHADLYKAYGMKMPKGALLSGPPGCGKTMFARAAAAEMGRLYGDKVEFISISGSELQSKYVGETEERIKAMFVFAREYKNHHGHPLLIFMDEAEVLLPDRTGRVRRVAPWEESQVATFLAEMDGMQESGAFMLLATNRPEVIDQAVLRDGRCDFKIVVQRPTQDALEFILRKNFDGALTDDVESLVFAALESLLDPHKIIAEAHSIGINMEAMKFEERGHKHFLLEHIVSGAMAASVPGRAKRYAFVRDKTDGVARGITVSDVIAAVNDIFQENRGLDHSYALEDFKRQFEKEVRGDA